MTAVVSEGLHNLSVLHTVIIGDVRIVKFNPILTCYCSPLVLWLCRLYKYICQCLWSPQLGQSEVNIISHILHRGTGTQKVYVFTKRDRPGWPGVEQAPSPLSVCCSQHALRPSPCAAVSQQEYTWSQIPNVVLENSTASLSTSYPGCIQGTQKILV